MRGIIIGLIVAFFGIDGFMTYALCKVASNASRREESPEYRKQFLDCINHTS